MQGYMSKIEPRLPKTPITVTCSSKRIPEVLWWSLGRNTSYADWGYRGLPQPHQGDDGIVPRLGTVYDPLFVGYGSKCTIQSRTFCLLVCCLKAKRKKHKKNIIYKTIILPVILYGCENWSLTLREEHWLRVFDNRVLRRIFEIGRASCRERV
jgi:hypothetical protein